MIEINQTNYTRDNGNCLTACVASILEIEMDSLPEFCVDGQWFDKLDSFCNENGFFLIYWKHSENIPIICLGALVILLLSLEGEETLHAVVGRTVLENKLTDSDGNTRWGWKTEIVHDPNKRGYPPIKDIAGYIIIGKQ